MAERLEERNIPFAFISGHSARELPDAMRGRRVLSKPIESEKLLEAVEQMCPGV